MPRFAAAAVFGLLFAAGCSLLVAPERELVEDGGGGQGGSGGGTTAECVEAEDCPTAEGECEARACEDGVCTTTPLIEGVLIGTQTAGDCRRRVCNGRGEAVLVSDTSDVPVDGEACTDDLCASGEPVNPASSAGTPCGDGLACDGAGQCTGCDAPSECPGRDTECTTRTCERGVCGMQRTRAGTPLSEQTEGDCLIVVCDGRGGTTTETDDGDVADDGMDCTVEGCSGGVPTTGPAAAGTPCGDGAGLVCDGAGMCVGCVDATDCPSGICDDGTCGPVVVLGTTPADGSISATVTTNVSIAFSGPINPSTITKKTTLDSGPCSGSVQLSTDDFVTCVPFSPASPVMSDGDTVVTLTPAPGLAFGSTFKVRVTAAVTDALGIPIASSFTTPAGFETRYGVQGSDVVISQIYGGGGNVGAPLSNDFVELHNRGPKPVGLAGWSLQYASPQGTTWSMTALSGTILPGGFYLIKLGSGGPNGAPLPTPDATGFSNMSAQSGKIALVRSGGQLSALCPTSSGITDFVGYGTSTCFEGSGAAPLLSVSEAAARPGTSCTDTGDNGSDFVIALPAPRNAGSTVSPCVVAVPNESDLAYEADACELEVPTTLALVTGTSSGPILGRVLEAGATEAPGPGANIVAQLGFGPRTQNPQHQVGWTWVAATFESQQGTSDRFSGSFTAPAPGSYAFTYRVSVDGGTTWTYCDADGAGSSSGASFATPQLGLLDVTN
jgi:hypothetical protein